MRLNAHLTPTRFSIPAKCFTMKHR